jgi:hypothetical protein
VLVVKAPPEQRSRVIHLVGAAVGQTADSSAHVGVNFSVDVDPQ